MAGIALLGGDDGAEPSPSPVDVPRGRVVFASDREGDFEVYIADGDGSDPRNLTNDTARDEPAAPSPDGDLIAFRSNRDGPWEIYVMADDGSDVRRLTDGRGQHFWPSWSPDGERVAFTRDRDGGTAIVVVASDGSDVTEVVSEVPGHPGFSVLRRPTHARPMWTPDGAAILFEASDGENVEIFRVTIGSGEVDRLTDDPADDRAPAPSPDGETIVFTSDRGGEGHAVYAMTASGDEVTEIASSGSVPSFTPDGEHIVFVRGGDIYLMDADGGDPRRIVSGPGTEHAPRWVA